jgi:branched-chain amino acid aminotransferase
LKKNIEPYDIYTADEAFITGTPFCILPVFRFNETNVGNGKFGVITKKIINKWGKNVGLDIIQQIKNFNKESQNVEQLEASTPYQFSSNKPKKKN